MSRITKRFPGVIALDGVDLEVGAGEIVALAGENGAGKSTLMKILGGIYQPDSGSVRIGGHEVVIGSASEAIALGIGFIHQELNVLDNLDIAENVLLGREPVWAGPLKLVDRRALHTRAAGYVERLGLGLPTTTRVNELSIAQQQIVEIAKALSQDARIVIMDEPASCLTLSETERLLATTRELSASGVGIIYITHRLREISEIADRVVVLRDGRNAGTLSGDEISHDRIVLLMVGRDLNRAYEYSSAAGANGYFKVSGFRTRRYPQHSVTLDVRNGEILGLAGLVGAGRSELARAVFGVEPAIEGAVELEGKRLSIKTPRDAIENGIHLISEDRRKTGLVLDMAVRENITLPSLAACAPAGVIDPRVERTRARKMCAKLEIKTPSIEEQASNLSGGNQQKLVLAKWLAMNPKVLIFDEPTRGIDVGSKAEIYKLMRELAAAGVAIMMISSDMEEVLGESDRVAVMHEGSIAGILERDSCSEESIMRLAVGSAL